MKFRSLVAAAVVLSMATSAQAVSLVVMNIATHATNSIIPAGEQVVTFGIQVKQTDLTGAGTNPVLIVQDLTFGGVGGGTGIFPVQGANAASNKIDVQTVQSSIIDSYVQNNGDFPAVPGNLSTAQNTALFADSWWYNGGGGILQGAVDTSGNPANLTNTALQFGPIGYVGPTGYQWTPSGAPGVQAGTTIPLTLASTNPTNAQNGQYMMYSGIYGPNGANSLTGTTLASQFVNGSLTVPLAQIVTTGDISIPGTYSNAGGGNPGAAGSGTWIGVIGTGASQGPTQNGVFNIVGGDANTNPGFYYQFSTGTIQPTPEPGTIVLAGLGALGLALAWKRRK